MNSHPIFITGVARSGTTLLDKILSVPNVSRIFSQPLPLLFSSLKARFLIEKGTPNSYPLSDMFMENYYDFRDWQEFLNDHLIGVSELRENFQEMSSFSGQLTRPAELGSFIDGYEPSNLEKFLNQYLSWLSNDMRQTVGLKEIWCEEYLPFLLGKGFKCIQVIRDPRDLITSLNYGDGQLYGGRPKPLLFNVRAWRKSVAMCLKVASHPLHIKVKYEDLVNGSDRVITELLQFLSLNNSDTELSLSRVTDHDGHPWQSNSSHISTSQITKKSVGKYKDILPRLTSAAIEALCLPEMNAMGYATDLNMNKLNAYISELSFYENLERPELASYLWGPRRREEELERAKLISNGNYRAEYFMFEESFKTIRASAL